MRLSLGISSCPNDTYIYEALVKGLEGSPFDWDVHFADVQTLNEMVRRGELDVAKVSAQVYPKVERIMSAWAVAALSAMDADLCSFPQWGSPLTIPCR